MSGFLANLTPADITVDGTVDGTVVPAYKQSVYHPGLITDTNAADTTWYRIG